MQHLEAPAVTRMDFREWIRWHAADEDAAPTASRDNDSGVAPPGMPCSSDAQRSTSASPSAVAESAASSSDARASATTEVRCERIIHGDCR